MRILNLIKSGQADMFNLSTQEAETRGRLQVQGQLCLRSRFQASQKTKSTQKKKKKTPKNPNKQAKTKIALPKQKLHPKLKT